MSPDVRTDDGRAIAETMLALQRRLRALTVVEAAGWAAAAGVAAGRVTGASAPVAALVGGLVSAWRWRRSARAAVVRAVERADPAARNVFVTADELLAGTLTTSREMHARVLAAAAAVARRIDRGAIAPLAPAGRAVVAALVAVALMWTMPLWRSRAGEVASVVRTALGGPGAAAVAPVHVRARIEPPPYTGLTARDADDPAELQAIEGSTLTLTVDAAADPVTVEHDGAVATLARGGDRRFVHRVVLKRTGFLVVATAGARRTIPIVVSPDALPSVTLTAPGRDLVYAGGNARIAFTAHAADDFGLRSLRLRYTRVSGSGENFTFEDGEIPLDVARATPREWSGRAARTIAELNLKEGDLLVYRAVAADARDGDGTGSSDAFFIEISKLGVAAGDAFTLPEEESKYALSQQMLIVKTERLQQRRASLSDPDVTEAALNLAVEQRMIRAEFVFMLGGEVEDEAAEAEQSNELQEGRLQNRGQRDVRAATIAMSQAEKLLTGANTREALVAERAAVAALQRAFARDRYILRALATRSQLDLSRRLTGSSSGAADWRRTIPSAPANTRAALLQDLLRGISEVSAGAASAGATTARLLAEEAIRIDPASAALRQVSTELQRAADATDPAVRTRALAAAGEAAATEARRAHADAPLDERIPAPPLAGAFADAVGAARLKPSRYERGQR